MTYILRDGSKKDVEADIGDNVLELAHKHDIDLEGSDAIALYAGVVLQVPPNAMCRTHLQQSACDIIRCL